ncbi:hypothetical protein HK101_009100 [Irineochytrium annulatum]|nr:hypothetical protein HK101_009100 [Irineochytrium annulatum]
MATEIQTEGVTIDGNDQRHESLRIHPLTSFVAVYLSALLVAFAIVRAVNYLRGKTGNGGETIEATDAEESYISHAEPRERLFHRKATQDVQASDVYVSTPAAPNDSAHAADLRMRVDTIEARLASVFAILSEMKEGFPTPKPIQRIMVPKPAPLQPISTVEKTTKKERLLEAEGVPSNFADSDIFGNVAAAAEPSSHDALRNLLTNNTRSTEVGR